VATKNVLFDFKLFIGGWRRKRELTIPAFSYFTIFGIRFLSHQIIGGGLTDILYWIDFYIVKKLLFLPYHGNLTTIFVMKMPLKVVSAGP
jgi:hypothetical protein